MTELRILNLIVWGALLIFMAHGSWSALFGKNQRRGDAMRLACFAMAAVQIGFNLRWLFWPEDVVLWQALYVLSAGAAVYIAWLAHTYGRGPRV